MPTRATIDGIDCTIETLPDGSLRVTHESPQVNAMHGGGTGGEVSYVVHPAQRNNYEFINSLLPADQRVEPPAPSAARPWWSYAAGVEKDKRPEKSDGG